MPVSVALTWHLVLAKLLSCQFWSEVTIALLQLSIFMTVVHDETIGGPILAQFVLSVEYLWMRSVYDVVLNKSMIKCPPLPLRLSLQPHSNFLKLLFCSCPVPAADLITQKLSEAGLEQIFEHLNLPPVGIFCTKWMFSAIPPLICVQSTLKPH